MSLFVSQKLTAFVVTEHARELLKLNELVAAGKVRPVPGSTFPLEDGADAVAAFSPARSSGRVVITP